MPYSKDIRCGAGTFEVNVNSFFAWLDDHNHEIIVRDTFCEQEVKYHNQTLEDEIEEAVNRYILAKIFNETTTYYETRDPKEYVCVWDYVFDCVELLISRKSDWYDLRWTV